MMLRVGGFSRRPVSARRRVSGVKNLDGMEYTNHSPLRTTSEVEIFWAILAATKAQRSQAARRGGPPPRAIAPTESRSVSEISS